ncbi:hypothetical protein J7M28_01485 [bacterium]|nr:hypothetical protein [bacterium]
MKAGDYCRTIVIISAVCFAFFAIWPSLVDAAPRIRIFTDKSSYTLGETIEVSLSGENYGGAMNVDVYVGLITPSRTLYALADRDWSESIRPWLRDMAIPSPFFMEPVPFHTIDVPCAMPSIDEKGQYYAVSFLTYPESLTEVGEASYAHFTMVMMRTTARSRRP